MGVSNNEWLAFVAALIGIGVGAVQFRYWWTSSGREAAAAASIKAAAEVAKKDLEDAAEVARRIAQTTARKDALEEWQKLYGEKDEEVAALKAQNRDQQGQINVLRAECVSINQKHDECEERYAALAVKVDKVEKIANGTEKHK